MEVNRQQDKAALESFRAWESLCFDNSEEILAQLQSLQAELAALRSTKETGPRLALWAESLTDADVTAESTREPDSVCEAQWDQESLEGSGTSEHSLDVIPGPFSRFEDTHEDPSASSEQAGG